jgi:4-amino-4-deoxy-L-arabinose transferase-like glycosyltransferase
MFTAIYELLCGKNDDPVYASDVYPYVGLFTLVYAIVFAIVFYLLLGRWRPVWDKTSHWIITLIILLAIAFYLAVHQSTNATGEDADSFVYKFAIINSVIAFVYFFIISVIIKRASIFAKRTPF